LMYLTFLQSDLQTPSIYLVYQNIYVTSVSQTSNSYELLQHSLQSMIVMKKNRPFLSLPMRHLKLFYVQAPELFQMIKISWS
ncbi:hypothetical protein CGJ22_24670, partial [Vibrio parahaemolyticus]